MQARRTPQVLPPEKTAELNGHFDRMAAHFESVDRRVYMLYKSFTKRPSGTQRRKGVKESAPYLSVEQIQAEPDRHRGSDGKAQHDRARAAGRMFETG